MSDAMSINFWGVRGSYPVPGPSTLRYGGNTPCVEVRANGHLLILDAGTGIINLGRKLAQEAAASRQPIEATILLNHFHHDHTQGFPFFIPAYMGSSRLHIFGPGIVEHDLEEVLMREMLPPAFPIALKELHAYKEMCVMHETEVLLLGAQVGGLAMRNRYHQHVEDDPSLVRVQALRSYAHPGGTFVYRIDWCGRSVVYASDVEGYQRPDQRLVNFARGADILIHDAQYTEEHYMGQRAGLPGTQGWGHSTASMACDVAEAAGVKQLILFHHEPQYDDATLAAIEAQAQARLPQTLAAYEGLQLTLERQLVEDAGVTEEQIAA